MKRSCKKWVINYILNLNIFRFICLDIILTIIIIPILISGAWVLDWKFGNHYNCTNLTLKEVIQGELRDYKNAWNYNKQSTHK